MLQWELKNNDNDDDDDDSGLCVFTDVSEVPVAYIFLKYRK
jgi:hypothetical protein